MKYSSYEIKVMTLTNKTHNLIESHKLKKPYVRFKFRDVETDLDGKSKIVFSYNQKLKYEWKFEKPFKGDHSTFFDEDQSEEWQQRKKHLVRLQNKYELGIEYLLDYKRGIERDLSLIL